VAVLSSSLFSFVFFSFLSSLVDADYASSAQYNSFTGMAEITNSYAQRPIVVRHRQYAMLRPSADALALNIVDIPFKFVTIAAFDIVLYFMVGLQYSASQFFVFILFTFVVNLAMLVFFRMLSSVNRAEPNATLFAGLGVLIIAICTSPTLPLLSFASSFS
jgi:ABC-type multidrug transport system permease subunit